MQVAAPVLSGCDLVRNEIEKYPGWDHNVAVAIAKAENRSCSPTNHNLTSSETHKRADGSVICVGSYGVIQVGCLHYAPGDDVNDLATNIRIAYRVFQERAKWDSNGFNAWTMYTNGKYRENL